MAINFLNTVDLNKNQLDNASIQNLSGDPAEGVLGQIYYNTTNSVLKICVTADVKAPATVVAAVWAEVGKGNTTYTLPVSAGTAVEGYTVADIDLTAGGTGSGIASKVTFAGKNTNIAITETATDNGIVKIALTNNVTIGNDLTVTNVANIKTTDNGYALNVGATTSGSISALGRIFGYGDIYAVGEMEALSLIGTNLTVNGGILNVMAGAAIDFGANKITNVADPTSAQDAATKNYVDAVTAGGLIYQGGYDANTNTPSIDRSTGVTATSIFAMGSGGGPKSATEVQTVATIGTGVGLTLIITLNQAGNLTSAVIANRGKGYEVGDVVGLLGLPGHTGSVVQIDAVASVGAPANPIGVKIGWTYTVIADGTFYGEIVRVGDVLIAETDDPGALANWTTVQNNIDLASATQVGIGNVKPSQFWYNLGLNVNYSGGTATVGLDLDSLPTEATFPANIGDIVIPYVSGFDSGNYKASLYRLAIKANEYTSEKGFIPIGDLTGTVYLSATWGLDTMVQTVDGDGNTVFCDITRTPESITATVSEIQTTAIAILVQKIG